MPPICVVKNIPPPLSTRKAIFTLIGLMYPITMGASLFNSFKKETAHPFHAQHRSKINIMEKSEEVQQKRRHIINEVINVYNAKPNRQTEFIYDENATFEDPLIFMKGKSAITAMIHGIPLIVREHKSEHETVEHYEDSIVLKHKVYAAVGNFYEVSLECTQFLILNEENDKIKSHVDMWNHIDPQNMFGNPLLDTFSKLTRYINGNIVRLIFGIPSGRFIE